MRVELSIRGHDGAERDVAISAPPGTTAGELQPVLHPLLGGRGPGDDGIYDGAGVLTADTPLGAPGLCDGCVLGAVPLPRERPARSAAMQLRVVGGPGAGRIVALSPGQLRIGRDDSCELSLPDPDVSRHHATVTVTPGRVGVQDAGSTNGTMVDGERQHGVPSSLQPGVLLQLGNSTLCVTQSPEPPAAVQVRCGTAQEGPGHWVNRAPRPAPQLPTGPIEVPQPPTRDRAMRVQWIAALLPAAVGVALAVIMHVPQFLLFGLLSGVMLLGTALGDRVHGRRRRRRDTRTYRAQRAAAQRRIADGLRAEQARRRYLLPDAARLLCIATTPGSRVWERRRGDADLLQVRLGLTEQPAELRVRCGGQERAAGRLRAVPVAVDLRLGPLGIAAPPPILARIARWSAGQLATLAAPGDVRLALFLSPRTEPRWRWARWLPHVGGRVAITTEQTAALVAQLRAELARRTARASPSQAGDPARAPWNGDWLVAVIDRAGAEAEQDGLAQLLRDGAAVGLTAICVAERATALPSECVTVATAAADTGWQLRVSAPAQPERVLAADGVDHCWAQSVARALAPLRDLAAARSSGIAQRYRLLDALELGGVDSTEIRRRWQRSDGSPSTVLGVTAGGPLHIDLARDGPHALVAGTTGSGKSELLQSLVAGLAATHPPDSINFVLIDYKGGAAFADCARLPHTSGVVTDLDAQLTARALQALERELRGREERFARAGATDLEHYRSLGSGEPIARLILVVDEFAALAEDLPEFLSGLVGVAQRGRSLGVHLILATQRPGGVVSPEIRANTALRIALRVTDPRESADVIDAPDAAGIAASLPGRAFVRTGAGTVEMQTGYLGDAPVRDPHAISVTPLDAWRRPIAVPDESDGTDADDTDLAALVDALDAAAATWPGRAPSPWLPPLPTRLGASALPPAAAPHVVPVGMVDLPAQQRQVPFTVDLAEAPSLLVVGSPRSGRSCALVGLGLGAAAALPPRELHVYGIDAGGGALAPLRALTHCATLVTADDPATVATLLRRLRQQLARRAARLAEWELGSAAEARAAGHRIPLLLLLLDGWDGFSAVSAEYDGGQTAAELGSLLRAAPAAGLSIAVSGGRAALSPRLAAAMHTRLLLRLSDPADYAMAGIPARAVPGTMPPGRALRAADAAEVQLALPGDAPTRAEQTRHAEQLSRRWEHDRAAPEPDQRPIRLRPPPTTVHANDLPTEPGTLLLGVGGDDGRPIGVDVFAGCARLLVAGPPRSGRSTTLALLAQQCLRTGAPVVLAAPARSPLRGLGDGCVPRRLTPADRPDALGELQAGTLVLVDDCEAFTDTALGERLAALARDAPEGVAMVVAGRSDELAVSYRGVGAQVRRARCGLVLSPQPVDGELLGVRLPRTRAAATPPGRGILVADPAWELAAQVPDAEPIPIQVALP